MKTIIIKKKKTIIFVIFVILVIFLLFFTFNYINFVKNDNIMENDEILNINECACEDISEKQRENLLKEKYKEKKLIALTFDDGPSKYTERLVDELKKRDVKATFFILGENGVKRQDTLKTILDAGNEIGIHSYKHKVFTKLKDDEILEQISDTKAVIYDATNTSPSLMRVPYGSVNSRVSNLLKNENLENVLWTVDSKDWKFKNTKKIYNYTIKNIKGNDIILMHDIFKTSVEAALQIVDKLQSECYEFVSVSEFEKIKESFN